MKPLEYITAEDSKNHQTIGKSQLIEDKIIKNYFYNPQTESSLDKIYALAPEKATKWRILAINNEPIIDRKNKKKYLFIQFYKPITQ